VRGSLSIITRRGSSARPPDIQDSRNRRELAVDYLIKGKTAYVSAGAHGIGEAIADLLTQEGALVIVADHDEAVLREKAPKWTGTVAADLATADGVERAVSYALDSFGRAPDILINNLGVGDAMSFVHYRRGAGYRRNDSGARLRSWGQT
jgi:NAD(P)-dependent dehydrogenase (short-subunit alcohol dehydrogenase family)